MLWRAGIVSKLVVDMPCKLPLFFNWKVENFALQGLMAPWQSAGISAPPGLDGMGALKSVHTSISRHFEGAVFCSKSVTLLSWGKSISPTAPPERHFLKDAGGLIRTQHKKYTKLF